ncbi:MAG: hypothetical protein JWR80_7548 [Bradyrhizobium sp.]|nr:hypothetical protein [Bradyrhizobium sp.]
MGFWRPTAQTCSAIPDVEHPILDGSLLAEIPYLNHQALARRIITSLAFHAYGEWHFWMQTGDHGELLLKMKGTPAEAVYFAREAESENDLYLHLFDLLAQRACWPSLMKARSGIIGSRIRSPKKPDPDEEIESRCDALLRERDVGTPRLYGKTPSRAPDAFNSEGRKSRPALGRCRTAFNKRASVVTRSGCSSVAPPSLLARAAERGKDEDQRRPDRQ